MNQYNRTNNIIGWTVGIVASVVYLLTKEATVSLWDCGEFISCAHKLEVSHSPGAPFFSILARVWILLFGDNPERVATAVNSLSAVASGLTVMFLFWTITHFARKFSVKSENPSQDHNWLIFGAGLVGAFAFCFSDTFWFSAVEGEVYALSSLIMALVFWAMLKWEDVADQPHADRWIMLIALVMGISIGVHLLNLLTIPSLVMIYYFRKSKNITTIGTLMALGIGAVILGLVQYGIILYLPKIAFNFDIFFVNQIGLPFYSGMIFFFILFAGLLFYGLIYARKKSLYYLQLGIWVVIFVTIGYSSYISMVFRSAADTPIDMGSPDTAPRLLSFLSREQFGNTPLLTGPYYTSFNREGIIGAKDIGPDYFEGEKSYEYIDYKREYEFSAEATKLFPRIWDGNNPQHVQFYNSFLGISEGEKASGLDNLRFFFQHQFWHMYMRYFLWNYAGRANDTQGRIYGEPKDSPWITGISFLDKFRVGDLDKLPDSMKNNKAHNKLFMFPLILGILGMVVLYKKSKSDFWTTLALFFFTGIAIMLFVNNTPDQPRERDYSYVGSTYAFAIWIGLGVWFVAELLKKNVIKDFRTSAAVATVACFLLVPVIMGFQEWDDHDRSKKTIGEAIGYNYLEACAPNAILFTEGDNDTYPLWFCQEVLGMRRDVRIINLSLLSIDWYINQLNYKINESDPVKMLWKPSDYNSSKRDMVYVTDKVVAADSFVNLTDALKFSLDEQNGAARANGEVKTYFFPTANMKLKVDKQKVIKNKVVPAELQDQIVDEIRWNLGKTSLWKNDQTVLNIIAANMFDRPIYFSTTIRPTNFQGLEKYLLLEGVCLRFAPIFNPTATNNEPGTVNISKTWDLVMNKYKFGGANNPNVYFDEPNRRSLTNFRATFAKLAKALVKQGDSAKAIQCLDMAQKKFSMKCLPHDLSTLFMTEGYYTAGAKDKARKLALSQVEETKKLADYISTVPSQKRGLVMDDLQFGIQLASQLAQWANFYGDSKTMEDISAILQPISMKFPEAFPRQQAPQAQQQVPADAL